MFAETFLREDRMFRKLIAFCLLTIFLVTHAIAASVRELQLDEIVTTATVAFEGTCTGNRTERDPATSMVVTYTTFSVKDVLKGNVQATHVIKQIGGGMPDGETAFRVVGIPSFAVGEDYVVFLAGVSSAGFSSPIGLSQGKFTVRQGANGKTVTNGRNTRELTTRMPNAGVPLSAEPTVHFDLEEFKQLARDHANRP